MPLQSQLGTGALTGKPERPHAQLALQRTQLALPADSAHWPRAVDSFLAFLHK